MAIIQQPADLRPEWLKNKHARNRCSTYNDLLGEALADRRPHTITTVTGDDGQQYPLASFEEARAVKNRVYTCAKYLGTVSVVMSEDGLGIIQLPGGGWAFRFRVTPISEGKAHQAATPRDLWAYDKTREKRKPRRRKPTIREAEELAAAQRAADNYRDALRGTPIGGATDIRIWMLDVGRREPVTAAERARQAAAERAQAQRAAAQRQALQPPEASYSAASGAAATVRSLLDRWKSGTWA